MTGFAVGEAPLGEGRLIVEVRSLNHRFLEIRVRMPPELGDHSFVLEQLARERLERGRYDLGVRLEGAVLPRVRIDVERARAIYTAMLALRDEIAPDEEVPFAALLRFPDLVSGGSSPRGEELQASLRLALEAALHRLSEMREKEGLALRREIAAHLRRARECRGSIATRTADLVAVYRTRLRERLARLLADASLQVDPGRLEAELAILADRSDITEELARLESHFDQIERLLDATGPVGRRMDFLLQEVARETNTIGAKSQDAELAQVVVELKAETERMREQIQNVQ